MLQISCWNDLYEGCLLCRLRAGSGVGQEVGPPWVVGDIVGCGIKFEEMKHDGLGRTRVQVFFTRNGRKVIK